MRGLLPLLLLAALTACGQQHSAATEQKAEAFVQSKTVPEDKSHFWKPPADASNSDKALIVDWFKANDACRGGINVTPDDPICKRRDTLQDRLRERGWCWGAPMMKSAADDDWHRCGTYDTDNMTDVDTAAQRTSPDLSQGADGRSISVPDADVGDWYNESQRPKSPLLQAFENIIEPIDQKIGMANVLAECGIRGPEWHEHVVTALINRRLQPSVEEMRSRLSENDKSAAARFDQIVIDAEEKLYLGGQSKQAACRDVADMPFAINDTTF